MDDIRVLMIDDQFLSRRGLEIVLGAADGIEVVGGLDADVGDNLVIDLRPDVVLVGSGPDSRRAEEVCSRVRAAVPGARILVMSASEVPASLTEGGLVDGGIARSSSVDTVTENILRLAAT